MTDVRDLDPTASRFPANQERDRQMKQDFTHVYNLAKAAASDVANAEDEKLGPESARGMDCGFAWVELRPGNHPFVNWLKAHKIGAKGYNGGWHIWNPTNIPTPGGSASSCETPPASPVMAAWASSRPGRRMSSASCFSTRSARAANPPAGC